MKEKNTKRFKKPWPTKEVMEQVYDMNLWGGAKSEFYSGIGSHDPLIIDPYLKVLISFLKSYKKPLTVCDLGCGDFNIGKELVEYTKKFVAVDIVPSLIKNNSKKFKAENLEFQCLDIASDELPSADCAIIRQVLQHLSNKEIINIVSKLYSYKYVVLTEHLPEGPYIANKDIISGQGIRLKKQSGVNLLESPFKLKIQEEKELLLINLNERKGLIVTTLYKLF